jgi:hypothetical protein
MDAVGAAGFLGRCTGRGGAVPGPDVTRLCRWPAPRAARGAFILDTRDGHVWIWSENELITAADGRRRYGAGFIYQGKLRPGTQPGEIIEHQGR